MFNAVSNHPSGEDREAIRALTILGAFFFVASAISYLATVSWVGPIPRDATTLVVGRDFLNYWMYGRVAGMPDPGRFYDVAVYNRELAALLGNGYAGQNLPNPPSFMLLAAPFGLLSYLPALLCWTALGVGIFVWVAGRRVGDRWLLIPLVASPAAVMCLISGQSSFLTAALLIVAFDWLDRKPIGAGILIGLLTLKPQLGLLFPVMLIASGRWRVFAAAGTTALAIVAATAALFGPQVWTDYVHMALPTQRLVLSDPELLFAPFMPTIFTALRLAGAGYGLAMAVQGCFAAMAAGAVFWAYRFRRDADPRLLMGLLLACTICASPYFGCYDVLPVTFAALVLLAAGTLDAPGRRLAQLIYWLPLIQIGLGTLRVPGAALIVVAFAAYALVRLKDAQSAPRLLPQLT